MRKLISSNPLKTVFIFLVICTAGLLIFNACRKIDSRESQSKSDNEIRKKFFTIPAGTDPTVIAIIESIKRQDAKRNFVPWLAERAGYPIWNKAKIISQHTPSSQARLESDDSRTVVIPWAKYHESVTNAVLFVNTKEVDTTYKLLYASEYDQYGFKNTTDSATALNVFHLFAKFDYEVFGHRVFQIKDKRLAMENPINDTADLYAEFRLISITSCDIIDWCWVWEDETLCDGGCTTDCPQYSYSTEDCYTVWFDGGSGGSGGGGGGIGGDPDPGGGGGWENENPCRQMPGNNDPCGTGGGNGVGWTPVVVDNDPIDPIDSILKHTSLAINHIADSVYNNLSLPNNWEYFFSIIGKNGSTAIRNLRTDHDSISVSFRYDVGTGEILLGEWHCHPSRSGTITDRGAPSDDDISTLRMVAHIKNYVSFVECGNKRYAIVILDPAKAQVFFSHHNPDQIALNYSPTITGAANYQQLMESSGIHAIGSSAVSGIGYYSADSPNFDSFILLNP